LWHDAPPSGLEAIAEKRVIRGLRALRRKRTIVLVTHRTQPLTIADRVIEMGAAAEDVGNAAE
jgi:ABC-type transport system involved in cytochrome bd biosynthesis fused ATPase/permease subunit